MNDMISKQENRLRKVCRNFHLVENYEKAIADEENKWDLHHRNEITEMKSAKQLQEEGRYFDVDPEELIFLPRNEHIMLHRKGKYHSSDSRKKMSENRKGKCLKDNNSMFNIAKENHPCFEMKWFNNGIEEVFAREAPQNFIEGRLKRYWYNNGVVQILCTTPPEGFVKGRLKKT